MKHKRIFFPFSPPKTDRINSPSSIAYLGLLSNIDNEFLEACVIYEGVSTELERFEVAGFIVSLPPSTWILTYNLEYVTSLFTEIVDIFRIKGTDRNPSVIELTDSEGDKRYIVDIQTYFGTPLYSVINRLDLTLDSSNAEGRALAILIAWEKLTTHIYNTYKIYPSKTPGASSVKSFRRYITSEIKARGVDVRRMTKQAVMPAPLHWKPGKYPTAYNYDINAFYPHVMRVLNYPLRCDRVNSELPKGRHWIATVNLDYECSTPFARLPVRIKEDNGRIGIVYPHAVKDHRTQITDYDLMYLQQGGKVKINQFIEGITWNKGNEEQVFYQWATDLENVSLSDPEAYFSLKTVSRALHSKFAQNTGYLTEIVLADNMKDVMRIRRSNRIYDYIPLEDGRLAVKIKRKPRFTFRPYNIPAWEALTISFSRLLLYSSIDENTIYVDTDSIMSVTPRDDLHLGDGFGQWKLDATGSATIIGPRMYRIGSKARLAGLRTDSRESVAVAIDKIWEGKDVSLTNYSRPSLINPTGETGDSFSPGVVNYAYAEVIGNTAYVTRSPTRKYQTKVINRVLSYPIYTA
jgi:hypothetical protein